MDLQEPLLPERVAPAQAEPTAPERAVSHAFQANPNNLDTEFRAILDEIRRARRKLSGGASGITVSFDGSGGRGSRSHPVPGSVQLRPDRFPKL